MPKLARNLIPHFAQSIARTPTRYAVEGVRGLFLYVSVKGKCTGCGVGCSAPAPPRPCRTKPGHRQVLRVSPDGFRTAGTGHRLAAGVRQREIISLIDAIATQQVSAPRLAGRGKNATRSDGAPRLAGRVRAAVSAMYGWADKRNILDINPAVGTATPARRLRPADPGRHVGRRERSL